MRFVLVVGFLGIFFGGAYYLNYELPASRFRSACESISPGALVSDASGELEARGGRYVGKVDRAHQWTRPKGLMKTANCIVEDDTPSVTGAPNASAPPPPAAKVKSARFVEGDDLL